MILTQCFNKIGIITQIILCIHQIKFNKYNHYNKVQLKIDKTIGFFWGLKQFAKNKVNVIRFKVAN